jgi:glucose uptake protein
MMIPVTYAATLLLAIVSMVCWGSWANTMKSAGKWRFELYYFDYSLGVLLCATVAAFTFGSIEGAPVDAATPAFAFLDNLSVASKLQMAYAVAAGIIFNLANLLLVAAISVAGMAVAFPVGIGLALIEGVVLSYVVKPAGNPALLFGGVGVIFLAIVATALAYTAHASAPQAELPAEPAEPGRRPARHKSPVLKGVLLSLAAGLLMGLFYPLIELAKQGEVGVGPYAAAFLFAVGVVLSTPVFNLFFMNLPVQGEPVKFSEYFGGTARQHLLGLAGGAIWATGTIANFVASSAPKSAGLGPAVSYALGQGATLISTLWGLLVWKEFAGASPAVRLRVAIMLVLYVIGLAMLSLAPLYA